MTQRVDVAVVGAGPAGLATAIGAALRGMRVRVLDVAREGPVDKACGEGLLPDALACLDRLGVGLELGHRFVGIRFRDRHRVAESRFPAGSGLGVRRTELHRAMLARAAELGVEVEWAARLRGLEEIEARFVVGADGAQSRVRAWSGLAEGRVSSRRVGLRQHFAVRPWCDLVEVHWGDGVQAYVTPVGSCEVGVALVSGQKIAMQEGLTRFPALQRSLAAAETTTTARGAVTVSRRLRKVATGRVALVGDASGSVDAVTGEGMSLCFRQAEALVEGLLAGSLDEYGAAHRQTMRMARGMSRALLMMDGSPIIRRCTMGVLATVPGVFEGLLRVHVAGPRPEANRPPIPPLALPRRLEAGGDATMQVPDDLEQRLIAMIATMKKIAPDGILPATTFDSLAIDSLDKINLSFEVEETFGIEIPDAAIGGIRTVGDMVEGVRGLVAARAE